MPNEKLMKFLDDNKISYGIIRHPAAFTAQEVAHAAHVPGHDFAKVVMVKVDGRLAMAVVPATDSVSLDLLRHQIKAKDVELASEDEFRVHFPDCQLGAMPPFGNLYEMDVYVSPELSKEHEIAFNAGTHRELLRIAYRDFENLVHPQVIQLSHQRH